MSVLAASLFRSEAIKQLRERLWSGEVGVWQQRSATHITDPGVEIVRDAKINSFCSFSPSFR